MGGWGAHACMHACIILLVIGLRALIHLDKCIATPDQPENYIFIIGGIGKWHLAFGSLKLLILLHFERPAPVARKFMVGAVGDFTLQSMA